MRADPGRDNVKAQLGFLAYQLAAARTPRAHQAALQAAASIDARLRDDAAAGPHAMMMGRYTYQLSDRMVKLEQLQEQLRKIVQSARQRFDGSDTAAAQADSSPYTRRRTRRGKKKPKKRRDEL